MICNREVRRKRENGKKKKKKIQTTNTRILVTRIKEE